MARPWGGGRGEAQPLPAHDARPAAPTVSIPPACSLGVETEIYFNDSLMPNCIQAATQREEPPTCGGTTVRRALKAAPKAQGRQTVSFRRGQTAGPGAGSGAAWLHGRDPKNKPEKSLFISSFTPPTLHNAQELPSPSARHDGHHRLPVPQLQGGDATSPGIWMTISRASGQKLFQGVAIS